MKYPIGIQTFSEIIQNGYVYIDKTELIHKLVNDGAIYILSRPRRFGKSLLVSTIKAYFEGKKELFRGLAVEQLETEWTEYPIFHVDFNGADFTKGNALEEKLEGYVGEWESIYGKNPIYENQPSTFLQTSSIITLLI